MRKSTLVKLHAAAVLFTERRVNTAKEIADILNVQVNSVYHYAKQPEWNETLDLLGFTGDRNFTQETKRDILKDSPPDLLADAKAIYQEARRNGFSQKKAITELCNSLNLNRQRANRWAKRLNWESSET